MSVDPPPINRDPLQQRLAELEKENEQLRADVQDMTRLGVGQPILPPRKPDALFFRPLIFQRKGALILGLLLAPMYASFLLTAVAQAPALRWLTQYHIGSIPLFDAAGSGTSHREFGLGLISFGGVSVGLVSMGGLSVGLLAFGGGSVGLIAVGGGSVGVIAIGGGALGYVALGGGACGRYVLASKGGGSNVFALNRQDPAAVELFTRIFPTLRESVSSPMPVVEI